MKHLTVDEIIEFVSFTELNSEAINLSASVNGHIRECEKCLKLVRAFQMIYDEFSRLSFGGDFKKYVIDKVLKDTAENENAIEVKSEVEEFDGYK